MRAVGPFAASLEYSREQDPEAVIARLREAMRGGAPKPFPRMNPRATFVYHSSMRALVPILLTVLLASVLRCQGRTEGGGHQRCQ